MKAGSRRLSVLRYHGIGSFTACHVYREFVWCRCPEVCLSMPRRIGFSGGINVAGLLG